MSFMTESLKRELASLYNAPGRYYHDMSHVSSLLLLLEQHRDKFADPDVVEAVIWFHDCIYDTHSNDNEQKSAEMAVARLETSCVTESDMERLRLIRDIIMATSNHVLPDLIEADARLDTSMFLDMDLSILGSEEAQFDAYEAAVRKEYGWVGDNAWRTGRAAVLTKFQSRSHIFFTDLFRDGYERKARQNIARSLEMLQAQDSPPTRSPAQTG